MIYQTTSGILDGIHHAGCFYLSNIRIFEIVTGYFFTAQEVNHIYEICQKVGYIGKGGNKEGFLNKNAVRGIGNVASGLTGYGCYMKQVNNNSSFNFVIARYSRRTSSNNLLNHFPLISL